MDYANLSPDEKIFLSRFRELSHSKKRTVTKTTEVAAQYVIRGIYEYFFTPAKISNSSFNLSDDELEIITRFRNLKAGSGSELSDDEQKIIREFRNLKR